MADKHEAAQILAADPAGIAAAAAALRDGGIVALPTETVYGLAARSDHAESVAAIYRAKGRPDFNPLIVHVPSLTAAKALARFDSRAEQLAAAFWPGALTLVLPLRAEAVIAPAVTAGLPTIALRCPAHPVMRAVLDACGLPLAAPSANRSGGVSPTQAGHVAASLGAAAPLILDGGACAAGLESTIIALREDGSWQVLRPGPIDAAQVAAMRASSGPGASRWRMPCERRRSTDWAWRSHGVSGLLCGCVGSGTLCTVSMRCSRWRRPMRAGTWRRR